VILRDALVNKRRSLKRMPQITQLALSAKQWKLLSARIKTKSIMQRACAITVTTSMAEIAMPTPALIPIDSYMLKESARIAILTTTTNKREDLRKIKLDSPLTKSSNSSMITLSLRG